MKNLLCIPSNDDTFEADVKVSFPGKNGGERTEGEFVGVFNRIDQTTIEEWVEEGVFVSEMVNRLLAGAKRIGKEGEGVELSPEEGKAVVLKSPECCAATRDRFFELINQKLPAKTSSKRRARG
jgi:hypothetical protein